MSLDISQLLRDWPYDPDDMSVRMVTGDDGRQCIQVRLDLGVLQMEVSGRPDGLRPEGCESWLEYYEKQQAHYQASLPDGPSYTLDEEAIARLLREGIQYYHRYVSFWHLDLYDGCARDTARNLRLFRFVRAHAASDRDKMQFDQWRPYVTMMHARAVATPLLAKKDYSAALEAVDAGIQAIWDFLEEYEQKHRSAQCAELGHLQQWRKQIAEMSGESTAPQALDPIQELKKELNQAVVEERFEEAARLRDEIRRLGGSSLRTDERL